MVRSWPQLAQELLLETRIFKLLRRSSRSPRTGLAHEFVVLQAPDWVNVIPLDDSQQVILVRQFRQGRSEVTLEIPGGMLDSQDKDPAEAAQRELQEETGYRARSLRKLGGIAPNPAIQDNLCHTFLATGLEWQGGQQLDGSEDIEVVTVPLAEIPSLIARGTICHSLVVVAFCHLLGLGASCGAAGD